MEVVSLQEFLSPKAELLSSPVCLPVALFGWTLPGHELEFVAPHKRFTGSRRGTMSMMLKAASCDIV